MLPDLLSFVLSVFFVLSLQDLANYLISLDIRRHCRHLHVLEWRGQKLWRGPFDACNCCIERLPNNVSFFLIAHMKGNGAANCVGQCMADQDCVAFQDTATECKLFSKEAATVEESTTGPLTCFITPKMPKQCPKAKMEPTFTVNSPTKEGG